MAISTTKQDIKAKNKILHKIKFFTNKLKSNSVNSIPNIDYELTKQNLIDSIIDLYKKDVKDIMTPRIDVVFISSKSKLDSIIKVITKSGKSKFPVFQDTTDNIIGIIKTNDILKTAYSNQSKFNISKILHKPVFVPETMQITDLMIELKKFNEYFALVIDEYGGISGIVTLQDIIESIVGDIVEPEQISDESDIIKIAKNSYKIDARLSIPDLNKKLLISLPTDEFYTLGGFIFDLFGKIPKKNEVIRFQNIIFKIYEIEGTRIQKIIMTIQNKKD